MTLFFPDIPWEVVLSGSFRGQGQLHWRVFFGAPPPLHPTLFHSGVAMDPGSTLAQSQASPSTLGSSKKGCYKILAPVLCSQKIPIENLTERGQPEWWAGHVASKQLTSLSVGDWAPDALFALPHFGLNCLPGKPASCYRFFPV